MPTAAKQPTTTGKQTKGRQKVQLRYIPNQVRREQTFRKRAFGLIKKAVELHHLTGSRIRVAVAEGDVKRYWYDSDLGLDRAHLPDAMKARLRKSKYAPSCTPVAAGTSEEINVNVTDSAADEENCTDVTDSDSMADEENFNDVTDSDFLDILDGLELDGGDCLSSQVAS